MSAFLRPDSPIAVTVMNRIANGHVVRQSGVTIIELVATILILAIALSMVTFGLQGGIFRSADPMIQLRATALAQAYLDEILGKRFDENTPANGVPPCRASAPPPRQCSAALGPDGAEDREDYDDVDDYDLLNEGDGQTISQLHDSQGNVRDGYDNFRVTVDVRWIEIGASEDEENLSLDNELNDTEDAKVITVTVYYRGLPDGFKFTAYKSNF